MKKPSVAGIRITRNCNMMCPYCNIPNMPRENLTLDEWKKAFNIILEIGIKKIVILGGEPTMFSELPQLIDYGVNCLGMDISMTTNAKGNYEIIDECIENGLQTIGVSVDNLTIKNSISPMKCKCGLDMIEYLKKKNNKIKIVDYIVLNKKNVDNIISLIKNLTSIGVYSYILPFHWGNEGNFEHRKDKNSFAFVSEEDLQRYKDAINEIIKLKEEGYLINNSKEYLSDSIKYIKNLNWKCSGFYELRVDSDGRMVCCCDKIGNVNKHYSIFNLKEDYEQFLIEQSNDRVACKGCLWPSAYEAELLDKK